MTSFDAWIGGDPQKIFFRFSADALVRKGLSLEDLRAAAGSREPEEGAFDGQPYLILDPVLSVEQVRRARRKGADKTTVRYVEEHAEVDVDSDPDFPLRQLAEAIQGVGGDWAFYWHRGMPEACRQRLPQWAALTRPERVECLRHLAAADTGQLSKLVGRSSQPSEIELGKSCSPSR